MREPRLWRYVLKRDRGIAPHIAGGICSLACCKPKIRRYAARGDWIIGFVPARESPDRALVRYAMTVTADPVPFAEYWRNHRDRRDAIYRPEGNGLVRVENERRDHADVRAHRRDISGVNVLLSNRYWYFGEPGQDLFEALRPQFRSDGECEEAVRRIYFRGRGQKYNGLAPNDFVRIKDWLEGIAVGESEKDSASPVQAAAKSAEKRQCSATCGSRP